MPVTYIYLCQNTHYLVTQSVLYNTEHHIPFLHCILCAHKRLPSLKLCMWRLFSHAVAAAITASRTMAMNCMTGLQAATTNQQKITTMTQQWQLLSLQTTQYAICIFMHVCNHADQTDSVMPWPLVKPLRLFANRTSVCFIYKVTGQWACSPEHDWATNDMETMLNSKLKLRLTSR